MFVARTDLNALQYLARSLRGELDYAFSPLLGCRTSTREPVIQKLATNRTPLSPPRVANVCRLAQRGPTYHCITAQI